LELKLLFSNKLKCIVTKTYKVYWRSMKQIKVYKYRINPTKRQEEFFAKSFWCARFVYNKLLEESINNYKLFKGDGEWRKLTNPWALKLQYPFLKEVDSLSLCNVKINLEQAFKNMKTHCSFPQFKKKGWKQSYKTNNQWQIKIENNKIKLPKIGLVRITEHIKCEWEIKNVTISKVCWNYFVSVAVNIDIQRLQENSNTVWIDLWLKTLATLSNGEVVENVKPLKKHERKMKRLQREVSRRQKWSKRRKMSCLKLHKLHNKVKNIRLDHLHKVTSIVAI